MIVGYNPYFDWKFIQAALREYDLEPSYRVRCLDCMVLAFEHLKPLGLKGMSLDAVRAFLDWDKDKSHTALKDTMDVKRYLICISNDKHKAFEDWLESINEEHPKNLHLHRDMLREIWQGIQATHPRGQIDSSGCLSQRWRAWNHYGVFSSRLGNLCQVWSGAFFLDDIAKTPDYPRIKWSPEHENYLSQEIWVIIQEIYGVEQ
jgi:hypothetical protein